MNGQGADLNRRHTDFQSDILAVSAYFEMSYGRKIGCFRELQVNGK